jgi:hypothetical protein
MARMVASSADEKDQRGPNNLFETDDKTVRMTNGMKFTMGKWLRFQAEEWIIKSDHVTHRLTRQTTPNPIRNERNVIPRSSAAEGTGWLTMGSCREDKYLLAIL